MNFDFDWPSFLIGVVVASLVYAAVFDRMLDHILRR